jgi:hypothetical protein
MPNLGVLKTALEAWQQRPPQRLADKRSQALQLFNFPEQGQQQIVLDIATVGQQLLPHSIKPAWRCWHGDTACDTWLSELQRCGLVWSEAWACYKLNSPLAEVAHIILQDPTSGHYGSRLWVQDGKLVGSREVSTYL